MSFLELFLNHCQTPEFATRSGGTVAGAQQLFGFTSRVYLFWAQEVIGVSALSTVHLCVFVSVCRTDRLLCVDRWTILTLKVPDIATSIVSVSVILVS